MVGIYCVRNIVNNHRYIGQSVDLGSRKYDHFYYLNKGTHPNIHLQSAYNIYGKDNFVFEVLEECKADDLSEREIFWIDFYGGYNSSNLYNLTAGGKANFGEHNPRYGKHWSEEWRAKQSQRMKEYLSDPTHHPLYGVHPSDETIEKQRKSHTGKVQTAESNKKRSDTLKRKYASGEIVAYMQGKHHTELTKNKLRNRTLPKHTLEQRKKISMAVSGERNGMYGKTHTPEVRARLSESHKGKKNYAYGKVRITDGVVNKYWDKDTLLPPGFRLGMRPRKSNVSTTGDLPDFEQPSDNKNI